MATIVVSKSGMFNDETVVVADLSDIEEATSSLRSHLDLRCDQLKGDKASTADLKKLQTQLKQIEKQIDELRSSIAADQKQAAQARAHVLAHIEAGGPFDKVLQEASARHLERMQAMAGQVWKNFSQTLDQPEQHFFQLVVAQVMQNTTETLRPMAERCARLRKQLVLTWCIGAPGLALLLIITLGRR